MSELEQLKNGIRELADACCKRSKDEIYVPAYRAAYMEVAQELTKLMDAKGSPMGDVIEQCNAGIMSREETERAFDGRPA